MEAKTDAEIVESLLIPETAPEEQTVEGADETQDAVEDAEMVDEAEGEEPETEEAEADEFEETDSDESDDEDDAEDEADDDDSETPKYLVKNPDGTEEWKTGEELAGSFMRQADYTRKTQEVSEMRKQIESAHEEIRREAQALHQQREQILQLSQVAQQGGFMPQPQEPDPQMLKDDPIGYMEADAAYKQQMRQWQEQQHQLQQQQHEAQRYYAQQRQQVLEQNKKLLVEMVPEFGDAEKAPKLRDELVDLAMRRGYSEEEIKANMDARRVKDLYDLAQYEKLKAGRDEARKPKRKPKPVKSANGNRKAPKDMQRRKQLEKARRTQSDEDWASFLLE